MDLLLLQGRGFSFGLYLHVRVSLGACDVICGPTNTIVGWWVKRGGAEGEGVMARLLDGARRTRGCFVSVFFAPSHETTVFCLHARKEAAKIGGGRGCRERERNKAKIENGKCFG